MVGRTWAGTNLPGERRDAAMEREREERRAGELVKSEYGISSEESGYKSENQRDSTAEAVQVIYSIYCFEQIFLRQDNDNIYVASYLSF